MVYPSYTQPINYTHTFVSVRYIPKTFSGLVFFTENNSIGHIKNGEYHRLDGPASYLRDNLRAKDFLILNKYFTEERYWKQPKVIAFMLKKKFETIVEFECEQQKLT